MQNSTSLNTNTVANSLWVIVAVLVLAVLILFSYKYKNLLEPSVITTAVLDKSCDLRLGACTSTLPSGEKISLSINPNNIPLQRPLSFHVKTEGINASDVEVDIIGIGMDMGFNRTKLLSDDKTNYHGNVILPICSNSRMDWEARILVKTKKGIIMVPYSFFTKKR